jgi:hypothetical protein
MFTALVVCALALAAPGCGGQTHHAAAKHKPKHTILVHASLGYGAFHRFVWIPAHGGQLADPASQAVSRGAEAARFAATELKTAARHLRQTKRLEVLFAPLEVTAEKIAALAATLSHHASLTQIKEINGILGKIAATAKANGHRIVDASAARIAAAGGPQAQPPTT